MKNIAVTLVLLLIFATISHTTQEADIVVQAINDARKDAEKDISKTAWFFTGCVLSLFGYALALSSYSEIPIERFMGKSPEYVTIYIEEYHRKSRSLKSDSAFLGWIFAVSVVVVVIVFNQSNRTNNTLIYRY